MIRAFPSSATTPLLTIDAASLLPDTEVAARNASRIEAARQALGEKWIAHAANAVRHRDDRKSTNPNSERR